MTEVSIQTTSCILPTIFKYSSPNQINCGLPIYVQKYILYYFLSYKFTPFKLKLELALVSKQWFDYIKNYLSSTLNIELRINESIVHIFRDHCLLSKCSNVTLLFDDNINSTTFERVVELLSRDCTNMKALTLGTIKYLPTHTKLTSLINEQFKSLSIRSCNITQSLLEFAKHLNTPLLNLSTIDLRSCTLIEGNSMFNILESVQKLHLLYEPGLEDYFSKFNSKALISLTYEGDPCNGLFLQFLRNLTLEKLYLIDNSTNFITGNEQHHTRYNQLFDYLTGNTTITSLKLETLTTIEESMVILLTQNQSLTKLRITCSNFSNNNNYNNNNENISTIIPNNRLKCLELEFETRVETDLNLIRNPTIYFNNLYKLKLHLNGSTIRSGFEYLSNKDCTIRVLDISQSQNSTFNISLFKNLSSNTCIEKFVYVDYSLHNVNELSDALIYLEKNTSIHLIRIYNGNFRKLLDKSTIFYKFNSDNNVYDYYIK